MKFEFNKSTIYCNILNNIHIIAIFYNIPCYIILPNNGN